MSGYVGSEAYHEPPRGGVLFGLPLPVNGAIVGWWRGSASLVFFAVVLMSDV